MIEAVVQIVYTIILFKKKNTVKNNTLLFDSSYLAAAVVFSTHATWCALCAILSTNGDKKLPQILFQ